MSTLRIPMTTGERAFVDLLRKLYPSGAAYPLDGPADAQTRSDTARLIHAGIVERSEQEGLTETGEIRKAAAYRLADDFVAECGGTSNPENN